MTKKNSIFFFIKNILKSQKSPFHIVPKSPWPLMTLTSIFLMLLSIILLLLKKNTKMRTIKKHNTRISGLVVPSEICFLFIGLCFLGSWLFQQPFVPVQIIKKPITFTENHTILNLFGWHGNKFQTGMFFWVQVRNKSQFKICL